MERHKTCSFFGHRKIDTSNNLKQIVKNRIEELITQCNVHTFLLVAEVILTTFAIQ